MNTGFELVDKVCEQHDISPNTLAEYYLDGLNNLENKLPLLFNSLGVELIAEERQRQIEKEGWTPEHDDEHINEEMALAAACYVTPSNNLKYKPEGFFRGEGDFHIPYLWPWADKWYKPSPDSSPDSRIRELVKSGALIAAEIERIQRALEKNKAKAESE